MSSRLRTVLLASILAVVAAATAAVQPRSPGAVPAPASVLGWEPCADYKLASYEQIADYFRKLDASSERMQLFEIGKTAEGRTQLLTVISSEANLRSLARYKTIAQRLALARGLNDDEARKLAEEGRAVVWIDFGLHSSEVAHGQTAPLLAWKVVTEESAEMRFIREHVILVLVPNMNPDGTTKYADWYMKHVGTPFENSPIPELYHKYVGHDDNRDWYMFNMPESRNIGRQLYQEWFPQIVYNQHQTGPFPARIFIPPFEDPMNPNIPPLVMRGIQTVGSAMARRFAQENKPGVVSRLQYDTWWNGGMRSAPYFHNMVGILTEAQHDSATPAVYDPKTFPRTFANGEPTLEPSTFYPMPWKGGEWHLRDTCDYMVTASMAVLDIGAKRRAEWLYDIYQMGRDAMRAGANETYVISADQWDANAAVKLVNVLRWGGVEVERATAPFSAGGKAYPAGSFLVRGAQPFRAHLTDLLSPQVYPDRRLYPGGPPERPYDITGWTLSYQMDVKVDHVAEVVSAATQPIAAFASIRAGRVSGAAKAAYVIDPRANEAFIAVNRLLKSGESVSRTASALRVGDADWPPGAFVVAVGGATHARVEALANTLGLNIAGLEQFPPQTTVVGAPKVGLYQAWGGNMDEGWTRWLLEQFEFGYATVHDQDLRAGDLRGKYDVIVLPDATYEQMLSGLRPGSMPEEYVGGMTPRGVANLYEFVTLGGTLVAMDRATSLPIEAFGLPVRDVTAGRPESEFFVPGTILRVSVDPSQPVAYGMPADAAAFFVNSPAFQVIDARNRFEGWINRPAKLPVGVTVIARYPQKDLLMSGWILGEPVLHNRAAVIDATVGKGRIVLLGFRTQHRGQPHGTFRLLFNSVLLGGR